MGVRQTACARGRPRAGRSYRPTCARRRSSAPTSRGSRRRSSPTLPSRRSTSRPAPISPRCWPAAPRRRRRRWRTPAATATLGFGPGVFGERFGLAAARPLGLRELPAFPGDALDPAWCGGDLCVQACGPTAADARARRASASSARPGDAVGVRWVAGRGLRRYPATGRPAARAAAGLPRGRQPCGGRSTSTATSGSAPASARGWWAAASSSCGGSASTSRRGRRSRSRSRRR